MKVVYRVIILAAESGDEAKHVIERDDGQLREALGLTYLNTFDKWPLCEQLAIANVKGESS
jgi:hypothetical protein